MRKARLKKEKELALAKLLEEGGTPPATDGAAPEPPPQEGISHFPTSQLKKKKSQLPQHLAHLNHFCVSSMSFVHFENFWLWSILIDIAVCLCRLSYSH